MALLDEKTSRAAEQILRRSLSDEERSEIHRIADALGMKDVQSFLHLLLVFKLHEETMKEKFAEIAELEKKINETLENSIRKILRDGTEQIGAEVGKDIAANASVILSSFKEFYVIRGCIAAVSVTAIVAALAYWFGVLEAFKTGEAGGPLSGILFLPAGWCMLFSLAAYEYFWFFDHWKQVKKSVFHKSLLVSQTLVIIALLIAML